VKFLDDTEAAPGLDDVLDSFVFVASANEESSSVGADALVLVECRRYPLGARLLTALADEVGTVGVEALGTLGNSFIDVAEQCFGSRETLFSYAHFLSRSTITTRTFEAP
jgi:hypothetical protein